MGQGDKKRKTVSLDVDIYDALQEESNASATVNSLLREYIAAGRSKEAALNRRIAEKESELESARTEKARIQSRIERLEREIDQLRDRMHSLNDEERRQVDAVVGIIENGNFNGQLSTDNELVKSRAANAGMAVDRFIQEVNDRL